MAKHIWTKETATRLVCCCGCRGIRDLLDIEANTDELLTYFEDKLEKAREEPEGFLRDLSIKSVRDAEWHTLWSTLFVSALYALYNSRRISNRLDKLKNELGKAT